MKCELSKQHIPFTMVANAVLNDKKLSFRAKGLFAYLYSKPNNYEFSWKRIAQDSTDGETSVRKTLQELESAGYLERNKLATGRMHYFIKYSPDCVNHVQATEKPVLEKANEGKSQVGKITPISKIDTTQNKIDTENNTEAKDLKSETSAHGINTILGAFKKKINPVINFGNKSQRKAAEQLISTFGLEETLRYIDYLPTISSDRYAPTITTPLQLLDKYASLVMYAQKKQFETKKSSLTVI